MGSQIFDVFVWLVFMTSAGTNASLSTSLSLVSLSCRVGSTRGTYLEGPVTGSQSVSPVRS